MWGYIACFAIWIGVICGWLIPVIRRRIVYEVYESLGLGGLFSSVALNLGGSLTPYDIPELRIIGFILYLPAIFFVGLAFINLRHKGKPEDTWEHTTVVIQTGVYGIVRHPLYFGAAIWTVGVMLVFPSIPTILLGLACVACFYMASRKEDDYNIGKFGPAYREYMEKVPMFNVFKKLMRK